MAELKWRPKHSLCKWEKKTKVAVKNTSVNFVLKMGMMLVFGASSLASHLCLLSSNWLSCVSRIQCDMTFRMYGGKFTGVKPLTRSVQSLWYQGADFLALLSSFRISTFGKKCSLISLMRTNSVFWSSRWGDYLLVKVPNALTWVCYISAGRLSFAVFLKMPLKTFHCTELLFRVVVWFCVAFFFLPFFILVKYFFFCYYWLKTNSYFWIYWI